MAKSLPIDSARSARISVIGSGIRAAQCALTLAEMGIDVALITPSPSLDLDTVNHPATPSHELMHVWPMLLRAASHPRVKLYTNSHVKAITGKPGNISLKILKEPRFVKEELCTGCGKCEEECSVEVQQKFNGHKISHRAIHSPVLGAKSIPSAYYIDKTGISPCRANCPLGINVHGYIALLSKGKVDEALALIDEIAPMPGILGRLCTHPCENNCKRAEVDNSVFIQALHRYAADHAPGGVKYQRKAPAGSRKEKIAIIGSGPAGLTAGWELARRGYTPTIFESHAVVGGMLATGVPRFRLPREVREREVEAIKALGVDIKTGVTVGRDVTYADLVERGYRSFFLAIGAQKNKKLGIPGEDLEGVADCISLLFALNLKVGANVGSNVVVIGGGNSAVDSARAAKRHSKGAVRLLYRRTIEEMPAIKEDVADAINEGVVIDYLTAPLEILGNGTRVTGVRCQRMQLGEIGADGRRQVSPEVDSEFVIEADHVVIAVGQEPNTPNLNIKGLAIGDDSVVTVDPLTLETNLRGVFAGGDCVTGSNTVVDAMAAGLRAADSIDRYIKGDDLKKGRTLAAPVPVEVNIEERKASPYKRAPMPSLPFSKRKGNYEETNLGLADSTAVREAGRCINCALCCECLECDRVCELKAVFHKDTGKTLDIESESVINFISPELGIQEIKKPGIYNVNDQNARSLLGDLAQASTAALSAAIGLKLKEKLPGTRSSLGEKEEVSKTAVISPKIAPTITGDRTVVFLCSCGDGISSLIDFSKVKGAISKLKDVYSIEELPQSCTAEGSRKIKAYVEKEKISHVVLAACRCCGLEQICFSCTDRRVMCLYNLALDVPQEVNIEYTNIREQCAWVHRDDKEGATTKAIELISSAVVRAQRLVPLIYEARPIHNSVIIIGTGLSCLAAADNLSAQGYSVTLISDLGAQEAQKLGKGSAEDMDKVDDLLKGLAAHGVQIDPWPQFLELNGVPGQYEALIKDASKVKRIQAGSVILDLLNARKESLNTLANSNLISRVMARQHFFSRVSSLDSTLLHTYTVRETAGIFIIVPVGIPAVEEQLMMGRAAAARASVYLSQENFKPRSSSVVINPRLCRGCGDCIKLCPYIELRAGAQGNSEAYVDPALCFGCGACISVCPTGAIGQPLQSEVGIIAGLEALLKR
jgi:NADPH-dependent glutamate synthase beta subunit-like oxidoreductase/NAD-dependent dihydropyrimidine dehydrogenase PreA subunit